MACNKVGHREKRIRGFKNFTKYYKAVTVKSLSV